MTAEDEPPPNPTFQDSLVALSTLFERLRDWVNNNSEPITNLLRLANRHMIFERAGWLPHYTTPFHLIRDDVTEMGLTEVLGNYYRLNWQQVSAEFRTRLAALNIDEEAKATFCEALDAHEAGFYRATVRLLFPEIERVARTELLDGRLEGIASLTEIRRIAGNQLGFSEFEPAGGGPVFAQFGRMSHHLYEVAKTPDRVAELAADPVPNRHAALHGLVIYSTLQCSLNALIMAEFMFHVVTALKAASGGGDDDGRCAKQS